MIAIIDKNIDETKVSVIVDKDINNIVYTSEGWANFGNETDGSLVEYSPEQRIVDMDQSAVDYINDGGDFRDLTIDGDIVTYTPVFEVVTVADFKLALTPTERVAIKNSVDPIVQDFYSILEDVRVTHLDLGNSGIQSSLSAITSATIWDSVREKEILKMKPTV